MRPKEILKKQKKKLSKKTKTKKVSEKEINRILNSAGPLEPEEEEEEEEQEIMMALPNAEVVPANDIEQIENDVATDDEKRQADLQSAIDKMITTECGEDGGLCPDEDEANAEEEADVKSPEEIAKEKAEKQAAADEAKDNYDKAKENENSLANRTLGSLSMAATGIGGMELARGLAEQNADKAAEDEMSTYISTFQCKIGDNNKYYNGGEKTIETPGANQLIGMYQEYVELAASLKERKAALGMKPGIEAEVVLDKAATGLYDEVGHGIENGTYASLYRASKGNETDAKKLDDAKSASKKRVIGGGVAAGAGAVGGMVGNMIINGEKNSDDDSEDGGGSSGMGDVIKSFAGNIVEKGSGQIIEGFVNQNNNEENNVETDGD